MFDDTYNHEDRSETDGERAILFPDVKPPLCHPLAAINDTVLNLLRYIPVVQDARENRNQWSERLKRAEAGNRRTPRRRAGTGPRPPEC